METILITSLFIGLAIVINQDFVRIYDYFSNKLFGGKRLAPNETKFNS